MNLTKKPRLANITYVINFKAPEFKIRFKQAEIEAAFSGYASGQSQQTNIPDDADPAQPRIVWGSDTKQVLFSQSSCQVQMSFPDNNQFTVDQQLQIVRKNVLDFFVKAHAIFKQDSFASNGMVFDVAFPTDAPIAEFQNDCFDKFLKVPKCGKIASAQFTVGYEIDDLYLSVAGSVYERRQFEMKMKGAPQSRLVNIREFPVVEYGLMIKLDVNDRLREKMGLLGIARPEDLLSRAEKFLTSELESFSGKSLGEGL